MHDEVVLAEDGVDHRFAHARYREDVLDDEGPAQQRAHLQPHDGDEREARGSQRVTHEDAPAGQALGPGGGDEVVLQRLDEVGAQEAHVGCRRRQGERERRQEHRVHAIEEGVVEIARGERLGAHGQEVQEEHAEGEVRHRYQRERRGRRRSIEPALRLVGAPHRDRQRQHEGQHLRVAHQKQRHRDAFAQDGAHALAAV